MTMVSDSVVLGVVLAFCFGTSDYLSKGLTGRVGFYRASVYTLATSGALAFFPLFLLGSHPWPTYSDDAALSMISVSTFAAFVVMYRGYQRGSLSVVSPTVNSFPVFSIAFSILILKILVSVQVFLALVGVILGILLVSTDLSALRASRGRDLTPGVPEAIVAAIFFAIALTSLGYADVKIGYLFPAMAARLGAAGVGLLGGLALGQDVSPFGGWPLRRLLVMGVLEASGLLAYTLAFFYSGSVALPITNTLAGTGAVFTVGFALIFLKEKVRPNYAVGIFVLITSVGALLYFTA